MYTPRSFAEEDLPTLFSFIEANPLAALITSSTADGLLATHLPLVLDRRAGPMGTLMGHVARANPHSRIAGGSVSALVVFTGPDAYVTPNWYATKVESGRVVPTWNYVAVHAYGTLRAHDDPAFLRTHLEALTAQHEGTRRDPWQVSDAPADFIAQQMKAIVAVTLQIDRLEGKWKMSQNRSDADIAGVICGLSESPMFQDQTVAAIVADRRPRREPMEERANGAGTRVDYRIDAPFSDAALNALFSRAWPDHAPRAFAPVLGRALGTVAAFSGERLIGFVHVATDGGEHAFLLDPTVDPSYRRQGIGLELVRRAVRIARDRHCRWLHVDFEPQLAPFYHAAGFRHTAAGVIDLERVLDSSDTHG